MFELSRKMYSFAEIISGKKELSFLPFKQLSPKPSKQFNLFIKF